MLSIGPGFFIRNGFGTIIEAREIGENCLVEQMVTIGHKDGNTGVPSLGNNVYIGAGSKILGPVIIGDNVIIGANAIVTKSVPANCTVAGVPARIIRRDGIKLIEPLPLSDTLV
jgi:serine O-acetyltransferase